MKRVYLDWGVISNLKKKENTGLKNLLLSHKDKFFFVYSLCHLEDLMNSRGGSQFDLDIKILTNLVDDHLLDYKNGQFWMERVAPEECCRSYSDNYSSLLNGFDSFLSAIESFFPDGVVTNQLKANLDKEISIPTEFRANDLFKRSFPGLPVAPSIRDAIESYRQLLQDLMMTPGSYKEYRSHVADSGFRLETNAGNWSDEGAINQITEFLLSKGIEMSFDELLARSFYGLPFTWVEFFTGAYCLLDMMGFHADKLPKSTHTMRNMMVDAKHAVFAGMCDWFITADKGLGHKAKALYSHFGVPTVVMTPEEAISAIEVELRS